MLNSARGRCTSPRRRRLVEWSGQRRLNWSDQLAHLLCRRCASRAGYKSVGNAGSVDEATTDISLVIDSVKRCKGGPRIIESEKSVWRDKEESVSGACAVRISAHHPVPIVKSKQDCRNGARRIDREVQRPGTIPVVAVKNS